MKKLLIIIPLLMCSLLFGISTAKSIFYADSYMLRAQGVEANYWNPAKLSSRTNADLWFPLANVTARLSNNALDIDAYNTFVGNEYLSREDREKILSNFQGKLAADLETHFSLFGMNFGSQAFSSSLYLAGKTAFSQNLVDFVLLGFDEEEYLFDHANNNLSVIGYIDFTLGMGDIAIPFIPEYLPQIKTGFSVSFLLGLLNAETTSFDGFIRNTIEEGATMHQDFTLRTGVGGGGMKAMVGMYSELFKGFEIGATVDNIAGFINWRMALTENLHKVRADSIYVANLDEDFFKYEMENISVEPYSTKLPAEIRLAAMYKNRWLGVSTDWVTGMDESALTSKTGRLSFGLSLTPIPFIPFSFGISPGNSTEPLKTSYGIGLDAKAFQCGVAIQTFNSLFPNEKTRGLSFGSHLSFHF